jgi:anti-sigma-K factor RskA
MSEERRITSEDLALFAMQLLSKEETAEVADYVARSAEARRELAGIQGDLAVYAHSVDLQAPPAQARERLMKQLAREKKAVPIDLPVVAQATARDETAATAGSTFADAITRSDVGLSDPARSDVARGDLARGNAARSNVAASESERTGGGSADESRGEVERGDFLASYDPPRRGSRVLPWIAWIGWAAAAGLALTTGNLYREREGMRGAMATQASQIDHLTADGADAAKARQVFDTMTDGSAMRVNLTKGPTVPVPQGKATYVASKGTLIFQATNLAPLQPGKTYELWVIPAAAGEKPIPAGTFRPDERGYASVMMPPMPKGIAAKAFAVTMEAEGGAETPTMPLILAGE